VNPGFCEKMKVCRVPPGRHSRTVVRPRCTTGWEGEPLIYCSGSKTFSSHYPNCSRDCVLLPSIFRSDRS